MQHLLLLHGAIGAKDQLAALAGKMNNYTIHTLNFAGHGGEAMPADPFSIELFASNVLQYLHEHQLPAVNIFGYSMGGYTGMYLAKYHPASIIKLATLATKWEWSEAIAAKENRMLDAETIRQKIPAFAAQLEKRHAPVNWVQLLERTKELLVSLGKNNVLQPADYPTITTPALLLLGDRDKMVTLEETLAVYKQLPNAQLGILPCTPHPIEQANVDTLSTLLSTFFT
jgi:pimeloyl-ACP methyl ester carboxylesterase